MTSSGDVTPVTSLETLYVSSAILVGLIINASIIGNIANMVADINTPLGVFNEKLDSLDQFFTKKGDFALIVVERGYVML